jgi:2,3-bisphosphoglycerate-independent phosphoglycerate mutase
VLLHGPYLRGGDGPTFDEISCRAGQIGTIHSHELVGLAMAHAEKLDKFGA